MHTSEIDGHEKTVSLEPECFKLPPNIKALCLSGGGYRAMLFHAGAIKRLNELGILRKLDAITSVSGGSVLNGILAKSWKGLDWDSDGVAQNFDAQILEKVRKLAATNIRTPALITNRLNPLNWIKLWSGDYSATDLLREEYDKLFQGMKLRELPAEGAPRFIFCATTMKSGVCWRFERNYAGDYQLGVIENHDLTLAHAVAASSAFPLAFPPLVLELDPKAFNGGKLKDSAEKDVLRKRVLLADGGVYDNMGLEPVWKDKAATLIVSDGGKPFFIYDQPDSSLMTKTFQFITGPNTGFLKRLLRCQDIIGNQALALRKRMLIDWKFIAAGYKGTYFGLKSCYLDFQLPANGQTPQGYDQQVVDVIMKVRTDFDAFSSGVQAALINHGYTLADVAARCWLGTLQPLNSRMQIPFLESMDKGKVLADLKAGE
jgi:NTE family protein